MDPRARGSLRLSIYQIRVPRQKEHERSHFQKGLVSLRSRSRLVHLPGNKAPDLLHGVVSLFEVRLENLTPS